ncbi:putative glycoside hydrolase [Zongyangia hominis]|uniref:DUF4015 domain-containing protein n=1 Tax=Zongyangia hominis TaxID=2763677 RepID=A0A926EE41_9FIRM|nr:putative glycoside hydrolase [Zongyangia hominis]MBC8570426.1 hypothetical protein [Zongyangia hominis]
MSKPYKIKRNTRVYRRRSRRTSPLMIVLMVLGCAVLAFVGWSIYQPVYNLITGNIEAPGPDESQSVSQPPVTTPVESEPETPPEKASAAKKLMYLPNAVLTDPAKLDAFLQSAVDAGANGVMMDLKDANGYLLYQSAVSQAVEAGAVSGGAVDLPAVIAKLQAKNLTPVARIHAWVDHIASRTYVDMAIKYSGDMNYLWLDDTQQNGGKPWLNPYSAQAQKYITDIALELSSMGVKEIVLDGCYFPTMTGSNLANYGETTNTVTKDACLKNYIAALTAALEPSGTEVALYVTSAPLLTTGSAAYGGVNPATLGAKNLLVNAMPASFGSKLEAGGQTVAAPAKTPYASLTLAVSEIKKVAPEGTKLMFFVQGYTDGKLAADQNKTYAKADVDEQLRALHEQQIEDYLLFSPTGELPAA